MRRLASAPLLLLALLASGPPPGPANLCRVADTYDGNDAAARGPRGFSFSFASRSRRSRGPRSFASAQWATPATTPADGSGLSEWEVSTAAGDHDAGGYRDGEASQSLFSRPQGVALDDARHVLYVSDAWNHRIRAFDVKGGTVTTLAGTGERGYVDGAGLTEARFRFPRGLALSEDRRTLYVADGDNHAIRAVNVATGDVATLCGTGTPGPAEGLPSDDPPGQLYYPSGIALSRSGHFLYVADTWNCRIRAVDLREGASRGRLVTVAGPGHRECGHRDGPRDDATFNFPRGIAVSADGGTIYVADTENHRIRAIRIHNAHDAGTLPDHHANEVTTVAGSNVSGYKDGAADSAEFYGPNHLALSPDGKILLVVDTVNNRLRYVDLTPASTAPKSGEAWVPLVGTAAGDGIGGFSDSAPANVTNASSTSSAVPKVAVEFDRPYAAVYNANGSFVMVSDRGNNVIRKLEVVGGPAEVVAGMLQTPDGFGPTGGKGGLLPAGDGGSVPLVPEGGWAPSPAGGYFSVNATDSVGALGATEGGKGGNGDEDGGSGGGDLGTVVGAAVGGSLAAGVALGVVVVVYKSVRARQKRHQARDAEAIAAVTPERAPGVLRVAAGRITRATRALFGGRGGRGGSGGVAPALEARVRTVGWGSALGCSDFEHDFERLDDDHVLVVEGDEERPGGASRGIGGSNPSGGAIEMSPARRPGGVLIPKASPLGHRADRRVVPAMQTVGSDDPDVYASSDEDGDESDGGTTQMVRGVRTKKPLLAGSLRALAAASGKAVMGRHSSSRPMPLKLSPPPPSNKPVIDGTLRAKFSPPGTNPNDKSGSSRHSP